MTDEYKFRWITGIEYWILTNLWYWIFDTDAEWIKRKKWLWKSDNPRDHMNKTELLLTELTEETSKNLIKKKDAKWFNEIVCDKVCRYSKRYQKFYTRGYMTRCPHRFQSSDR